MARAGSSRRRQAKARAQTAVASTTERPRRRSKNALRRAALRWMKPLAQRCAEPCHVPAFNAAVFWMMKKAAESSQMSAAKDTTTSANGMLSDAGVALDWGCDSGSTVKAAKTIASRQRRPAVADWTCGEAVKRDGTLQRK